MATVNYQTCHRRCFIKPWQRPSEGQRHLQGPTCFDFLWRALKFTAQDDAEPSCPVRLRLGSACCPGLWVFPSPPLELLVLPTYPQPHSFSNSHHCEGWYWTCVLIHKGDLHENKFFRRTFSKWLLCDSLHTRTGDIIQTWTYHREIKILK